MKPSTKGNLGIQVVGCACFYFLFIFEGQDWLFLMNSHPVRIKSNSALSARCGDGQDKDGRWNQFSSGMKSRRFEASDTEEAKNGPMLLHELS